MTVPSFFLSSHNIFPFTLSVFDCSWMERRETRDGHIHFIMCIWGTDGGESKFQAEIWFVGRRWRRLQALLDSIQPAMDCTIVMKSRGNKDHVDLMGGFFL